MVLVPEGHLLQLPEGPLSVPLWLGAQEVPAKIGTNCIHLGLAKQAGKNKHHDLQNSWIAAKGRVGTDGGRSRDKEWQHEQTG
ncbi:unnamed protein product [Closterium sp. NIES-54]